MTSVKQTPPVAPEPETPKVDFAPMMEPQPSAREIELEAALKQAEIDKQDQLEKLKELQAVAEGIQMVRDENERLKADAAAPVDELSAAAKRVKAAYKVPKGEEGYHHVLITKQNGEALAEPIVKAFEPHQYETSISKFPGFHGDIIHKATK